MVCNYSTMTFYLFLGITVIAAAWKKILCCPITLTTGHRLKFVNLSERRESCQSVKAAVRLLIACKKLLYTAFTPCDILRFNNGKEKDKDSAHNG